MIRNKPWAEYLGTIEIAMVASLLRSVDVILSTSLSECESNAMMEAMSCGKTVIGKNISGSVSLLTDETRITFQKKII
ncbi:MAG: glycosyltransferase [Syntrophales bacterium]